MIAGPNGTAARLGMNRSTVQFRVNMTTTGILTDMVLVESEKTATLLIESERSDYEIR